MNKRYIYIYSYAQLGTMLYVNTCIFEYGIQFSILLYVANYNSLIHLVSLLIIAVSEMSITW